MLRRSLLFSILTFHATILPHLNVAAAEDSRSLCRYLLLENEAFFEALPVRFKKLIRHSESVRLWKSDSTFKELQEALDRFLLENSADSKRLSFQFDRLEVELDVEFRPAQKRFEIEIPYLGLRGLRTGEAASSGRLYAGFMISIAEWASRQHQIGAIQTFKIKGQNLHNEMLIDLLTSLGFTGKKGSLCYLLGLSGGSVGGFVGALLAESWIKSNESDSPTLTLLATSVTTGAVSAPYFFFSACPGRKGGNYTLTIEPAP